MRCAYAVSAALLASGASLSLMTAFPTLAQEAQNDPQKIQSVVSRTVAPSSFADLTKQLAPAVVNISTRQRVHLSDANPFAGTPFENWFGGGAFGNPGPQTREARSLGSGFIISSDGYVVTNNHVITPEGKGEVESITVTTPDGTEYPAKLVGRDAASDLAVLKISSSKPLPFVKFGDSRSARVGDWVITIGNPYGLGGSVTAGIISAVYRNTGTGSAYDRYLQTDAAINRGNSGGPMFDMKGQVIGIDNAIFSPNGGGSIGIGFAIPAEIAAPIVERLKSGLPIRRGYLGVTIQPLNDDLADSLGIPHNRGEFVQSVEPGKAAAAAGIQPGDVVLKVAGRDVTPSQSLSYIIANTAPGSRIPIELIRDGKRKIVTAIIDTRPSEEWLAQQGFNPNPGQQDNPFSNPSQSEGPSERALGLSVLPLTPQIARQIGASENAQGLVINAVDPSSDAGAKGLQRGDIILSANYHILTTVADLEEAIRLARNANRVAVLLRVQHRGQPAIYVPIRLR